MADGLGSAASRRTARPRPIPKMAWAATETITKRLETGMLKNLRVGGEQHSEFEREGHRDRPSPMAAGGAHLDGITSGGIGPDGFFQGMAFFSRGPRVARASQP